MKLMIATFVALGFMNMAFADQSTSEAAQAKTNDVKREMKKTGHHVEEAVCQEGDAKCLAKKAKHRTQEGADYTKDKANEALDKADSNSKAR